MAHSFRVGLTGGIGSGKSEVSRLFESLGVVVVDADIVAREVVSAGTPALSNIASHFGSQIITPTGELDRAALRTVIFNHPHKKQWLEQLLHPLIRASIIEQLDAAKSPYSILCSPLLIETNQVELVDRVLVIDATEEQQLQRATLRDCNSEAQIKKIMANQLSRSERLAKADDIIQNNHSLAELKQQVDVLHQKYLAKIK